MTGWISLTVHLEQLNFPFNFFASRKSNTFFEMNVVLTWYAGNWRCSWLHLFVTDCTHPYSMALHHESLTNSPYFAKTKVTTKQESLQVSGDHYWSMELSGIQCVKKRTDLFWLSDGKLHVISTKETGT